MKTRSLREVIDEVEAIRDKLGKPIDPAIKSLVIGLRRWGIKTKQSCEGHRDCDIPYPWIEVPINQAEDVAKLVAWQNRPILPDKQENRSTWVLKPSSSLRLMPENRNRPLEEMQADAIEFGSFLQNLPSNWGH